MKTTMTIGMALFGLPFAMTGCDSDTTGAPIPGDAMIEVTFVRSGDSGEPIVKVTTLTRSEHDELIEERRKSREPAAEDSVGAPAGENIGESQEKLAVVADVYGCMARGLLVYANPYRDPGNGVLCLMTSGHEAGGRAYAALPSSWIKANGGVYPRSLWSGDDSGELSGFTGGAGFGPWTIMNTLVGGEDAHSVSLARSLDTPSVDPSLAAPAGYPLIHKMAAKGQQIYVCKDNGAGTFVWTFSAPSALLFDPHVPGDVLGWHFAGPVWKSSDDNSTVKATKIAEIASPNPGSIPWLKLQATERTGTGIFANVAFIQRINTFGGAAPATTCDITHRNEVAWVDYSADYYFYATAAVPPAWTCPPTYYNTDDGCDCACGAVDPDCVKFGYKPTYGCAVGLTCNVSGQCVP